MVAVTSSCLGGGGCWSSSATLAWLHAELLMGQEVNPLAKRARACPLHEASVRAHACVSLLPVTWTASSKLRKPQVGGAPSDTLLLQSFFRLELHVPLGRL